MVANRFPSNKVALYATSLDGNHKLLFFFGSYTQMQLLQLFFFNR